MNHIGLYIHIPFCASKCRYCDFYSLPQAEEELVKSYYEALCNEITTIQGYNADTIYLGGGTPTYPHYSHTTKLLAHIYNTLNISTDAEISIECNPKTIGYEGLYKLRNSGINRLSIGLQSAVNSELLSIGRTHTFDDFMQCYKNAINAGFTNISVDVMIGLPGQTQRTLLQTLQAVTSLNIKHISVYALKVEEGTPMFGTYIVDDDETADFYDLCIDKLRQYGFNRYEISNFARDGMKSIHNLKYWKYHDYIGIGASAHSFKNNTRWSNCADIIQYINISNNSNLLHLTDDDMMKEFMFLGLRLEEGISYEAFNKRFKCEIKDLFEIQRLIEEGLLTDDGKSLRIPPDKMFVSNSILCRLM